VEHYQKGAAVSQATKPKILDIYRLTVDQFEKSIDAGVFDEDNVELLEGVLVRMTTNDPHIDAVESLQDLLGGLLPKSHWHVRDEKPLRLGRTWRPEPDITVLRGSRTSFLKNRPTPRDVALLVEVSDTTYLKDSGPKLRKYAALGIPVYWIVNLNDRSVEVYTQPAGRRYGHRGQYLEGDAVPVVVDGVERGQVAVREILS
jgi:Uma2 family endonuclease